MLFGKSRTKLSLLLTLILIQVVFTTPFIEAKETVAVLGLKNSTTRPLRNFTELSQGLLHAVLVETDLFTVVERTHLQRVIDEQKFSLTGLFDTKGQGLELGKLLTADYLLTGSLNTFSHNVSTFSGYGTTSSKLEASVSGVVQLTNVTTGTIDLALPFSASTSEHVMTHSPNPEAVLESLLLKAFRGIAPKFKEEQTSEKPSHLEPAAAFISIQSKPEGAEVYLNQEFKGVTPLNLTLEKGLYELLISKDGFSPWTQEFKAFDGLRINAVLNAK